MKWLEIIELNYVEKKPKLIEHDLEDLVEKLNKERDEQVINVYSRVSEEIDFRRLKGNRDIRQKENALAFPRTPLVACRQRLFSISL